MTPFTFFRITIVLGLLGMIGVIAYPFEKHARIPALCMLVAVGVFAGVLWSIAP